MRCGGGDGLLPPLLAEHPERKSHSCSKRKQGLSLAGLELSAATNLKCRNSWKCCRLLLKVVNVSNREALVVNMELGSGGWNQPPSLTISGCSGIISPK